MYYIVCSAFEGDLLLLHIIMSTGIYPADCLPCHVPGHCEVDNVERECSATRPIDWIRSRVTRNKTTRGLVGA